MKETPNHKIRYPEGTDNNAYVADLTHVAEDVERELDDIGTDQLAVPGGTADKGKLLVVDNTGAAAFQAMKGDATLAADGTISISDAKISTKHLADGLLTTAKYGDKSITEAKLADALAKYLHDERVPVDGSVTSRKFKPTVGKKHAAEQKELGAAYIDIPGTTLEIAPAVASTLILDAYFSMALIGGNPAASVSAQGCINVDGVDLDTEELAILSAFKMPDSQNLEATVSAHYVVTLTATPHTIKLRAKKGGTTNGKLQARSGYRYMLAAS